MPNLIDLLRSDGFTLKRAATTNGGEYAGPCPFCGGRDRFRVWPETGRYWCRSCGETGDEIQYLREHRGFSFPEACRFLGKELRPLPSRKLQYAQTIWQPKAALVPSATWQEKAMAYLDKSVSLLWSPQGETMRTWLRTEKGLSDDTIKASSLGLSLNDLFEPRSPWGLEQAIKEDGTERRQWIPAGLVIPCLESGNIIRLRIRRSHPGDGSRYIIVSGSDSRAMLWGQYEQAFVIVESELDGILLSQEAGDSIGIVAIGSAQARPDKNTHERLLQARTILVSLDADPAGRKAAWSFWISTYGTRAKRWPCVGGKDPSDAWMNGLNLANWITAGLA